MDRRRPASWSRLIASSFLLTAGVLLGPFSRIVPRGTLGTLAASFAGIIFTLVAASPIEWIIHRYFYHRCLFRQSRRIYAVHAAHHHVYFPASRYVTSGRLLRIRLFGGVPEAATSVLENGFIRAEHFGFYLFLGSVFLVLPAWLLTTRNAPFVAGVFTGIAPQKALVKALDRDRPRAGNPVRMTRGAPNDGV
jgi:hypothetical protein